jgi:hypothetical protein
MSAENTVSVVIPAYNAASTLAETLDSVRGQTWRALEIIVVDDGSTDATAEIAGAHAAEDPRLRILSLENGGVARARNAGIAASRGAFVAPVDADDLWHPEKIARQMAVMAPDIGFVYTFFRRIDRDSKLLPSGGADTGTRIEGAAYLRGLLHNFVGNGSSLLVRREALTEVGGYDPDLPGCCEDVLLQMLIARTWRVGCVPEYLTGYRILPTSRSADREPMARSYLAALEVVGRRFPETPRDVLGMAEASMRAFLFAIHMRQRRPRDGFRALAEAVRRSPSVAFAVASDQMWRTLRGRLSRAGAPASEGPMPPFRDLDPRCDVPPFAEAPLLARQLRALEAREEAFFATRRLGSGGPLFERGPAGLGAVALAGSDGDVASAGSRP